MLAELNRALSHLGFLGSYPPEIARHGSGEPRPGEPRRHGQARARGLSRRSWRRSPAAGCTTCSTGSAGSRRRSRRAGWPGRPRSSTRCARPARDRGHVGQDGFRARTRGIGVLTAAQVRQYGVSGPAARASGVDFDLRRDEPYLAYAELAGTLRVLARTEGDCLARFECLLRPARGVPGPGGGVRQRGSPACPRAAERRLPKVFKVPEGHALRVDRGPARAERLLPGVPGRQDAVAAQAEVGVVQQRAVLGELLPGHRVADLTAILGRCSSSWGTWTGRPG